LDTFSKYQLPPSYFLQSDVVHLAKDLIGKILYSNINGYISAAIITETEAYAGLNDKASHAYGDKKTPRTKTMYLKGGHAYIYLVYGIHHLLNIVTNKEGIPHAVLIRGGYPIEGVKKMIERNQNRKLDHLSLIGPGKFSKLMGIHKSMDGIELKPGKIHPAIWIEDWGLTKKVKNHIETSKRIGIDYAEEDADLPYRFYLPPKSNEIISVLKQVSKPINY